MTGSVEADLPLEATLRCAVQGDQDAWRLLVERYTPRVFGLLLKQCSDRELAEEITQATFVAVVTKLADGYDERGRFESWLFRIAMNALRDEMRRRKRQAVVMEMTPATAQDEQANAWASAQNGLSELPHEQLIHQEQIAQMRQAVAKMNEADREILHLRHTADLSFAQIAEVLDQPLGTVLARCHRALGKLRKLLHDSDRHSI